MLARFSKCDFWIPGQFFDLKKLFRKKRYFFEIKKNLEKVRNLEKVGKFRNFSMCFLSKLLRKPIENPSNSENFPLFQDFGLFRDFFNFKK